MVKINGKTIVVERSRYITPAVIATLEKHYSGLKVEDQGNSHTPIYLNGQNLDDGDLEKVLLDLLFFQLNPSIPLENLCNHIANYSPKHQTQVELLEYAKKLVELDDDSVPAGLFMYGQPGVGKTHIAVAVTKEFIKRGLDAHFVCADRLGNLSLRLQPRQTWVIDDLNSPYGLAMMNFKKIVINAYNNGGRLFVTSNSSYDYLMQHAFDNEAEQRRYTDRTEGMFKIIEVLGESERKRTAWYQR